MDKDTTSRAASFLVIGVTITACAVGCAPSTSQVIDMRKETWPWMVKNNYETVLKCFQGEKAPPDPMEHLEKAPWRIEALRTLHHIGQRFNYVTVEPELYTKLIEATKSEYERPRSTSEQDQIRAWAVCLLSQATPQQPVSYFVEVLLENTASNDPAYIVCLSALSALHPRMDTLAANPLLRRQMLYRLAQVSSDLRRGRVRSGRRKELVLATNCFQQRLKSYAAIVDLLRVSASRDDARALLEVLKWDYQQLKVGAHRSSSGEGNGLFRQNIGTLLGLSWHHNASIRSRSRLILAEFAPRALFDAVTKRVAGEGRTAPEDYQQLVTLMTTLDGDQLGTSAQGAGADYRESRGKALDALFAALPDIPLDQREVVYGQLLSHSPGDLSSGLLASNTRVLRESENFGLQHLRYLEHIRSSLQSSDKAIGQKIDRAVAAFMQHGALAVRKQVAASLAMRNPVLFAQCCVPAVTSMAGNSASSAEYLGEAYMDTLARAESAGLLRELRTAMGSQDPYELLAHGIARSEMPIRSKIASFLRTRNCDLLVGMLSRDLNQRAGRGRAIDSREWCLLGDVVQEHSDRLAKESLASASSVLVRGLRSSDPEEAMLCARYLLELGHDPGKVGGSTDVGAMAGMAQAKAKKAETPSKVGDAGSGPEQSDAIGE